MKYNGLLKTICLQQGFILAFLLVFISNPMAADVVVNKQGKCGYQDENGDLIVGYKYTYIGSFNENGLAIVMKGSKYGFINKKGVEVIPATYDQISDFDHGVAQITKGKKVGLIDEKANVILKPAYLEIGKFNSHNITWATKDKNKFKYSVINSKGEEIIPVKGVLLLSTLSSDNDAEKNRVYTANKYVDVFNFLSHQKLKGNTDTLDISRGYILHAGMSFLKNIYYDLEGKEVFNINTFNSIYQEVFSAKYSASTCSPTYLSSVTKDGVMLLTINRYNGKKENTHTIAFVYYDLVKQNIIKCYTYDVASEYIEDFEKHLAKMRAQAAFGKSVEHFTNDFEKLSDKFIKPIPHVLPYPFSEGFARITIFDGNEMNDVVINTLGDEVARYKKATDYQGGRMLVQEQNNLYGVVDDKQQFLIPAIYDHISEPEGDYYAVNTGEKYGTINVHNDTLVPIIYDNVVFNDQGITCANTNSQWDVYHIDTIAYQCTNDVEPLLYNGASSLLLLQKDSTIQVYDILTKNISDIYAGYTKALIAPSVHGGLCFEVFQETNSTKLYGYVNAHAKIVVPVVFENVDWAQKAYKAYKDVPAMMFTEIDVYRLRLHHTLRERTYKLNSIIPNSDWDY